MNKEQTEEIQINKNSFDAFTMEAKACTRSGRPIDVHGTWSFGIELRFYNDTDGCWIDDWKWSTASI